MMRPARAIRRLIVSGLRFLPNAMTIAALIAGMTAILSAIQGDMAQAAVLVLVAGGIDGMDGRVARRFSFNTELGAELDSLADFVDFGVAPALILYLWAFPDNAAYGWVAVLCYTVCCLLRLARFNVGSRAASDPKVKTGFTGVPSPAGALLALFPLFISLATDGAITVPGPLVAVWMVFVALMMISRVSTPALTVPALPRSWLLVLGVGAGALLALYPWPLLICLDALYLVVLLFCVLRSLRSDPSPEQGPDRGE